MRLDDAMAQKRRVDAVLRGWGISSDGQGGLTRPEVEGQLLALRRAYRRAGFGIETVAYFEGHGTGTAVGDATELRALSRARREAAPEAPLAAIGTIKALIGHTKAAAGVAGLIKAVIALRAQVLPPTAGCDEPYPELTGAQPALRALDDGEPWPADLPLRAGVSSMGFGRINAHVVLEGRAASRHATIGPEERELLSSAQDAELLLLRARDAEDLRGQVDHLLTLAGRLSRAEVADLAARLAQELGDGPVRAAVVASSPAELAGRLETLRSWLAAGEIARLDPRAGVFLGVDVAAPRIGLLFPGQGSPSYRDGGAWRRRFAAVRALYEAADLPSEGDGAATAVAQPAIVTASLAAVRMLDGVGVRACIAVGHSLGELTAYHWAGALEASALRRIAAARGRAMADRTEAGGAMASLAAGREEVEALLNGEPVVIAGLNEPRQTVISGADWAVADVMALAHARGLPGTRLPVSHAFHSPMMARATPARAEVLAHESLGALQRAVMSSVTGSRLAPDEGLRALLCRQVTAPVRFTEAIAAAAGNVDLWIEVGPGRVLSGLVSEMVGCPVVPLDACGPSLGGLLTAAGAAFALGAPVDRRALFAERSTRPFDLDWRPRCFENPCERAPASDVVRPPDARESIAGADVPGVDTQPWPPADSALELVRTLVAEKAELPRSAVGNDRRLLHDLHLNSIAVGQLVAAAARRLGLPPPVEATHYADATVAEVARALEDLVRIGGTGTTLPEPRQPSGVDSWIRAFTVALVERPRPSVPSPTGKGPWHVIAPADHPLAGPLHEAFARAGAGCGVVVCLPPEPDESHVSLLLEGARTLFELGEGGRFVLVQHGGGGGAFARTLHLEAPGVPTCVVDVPWDHPLTTEWVVAEAMAVTGFIEAHYDAEGRRREPVLRSLEMEETTGTPLRPADVVLVTGGGKGIAAESALALAREMGSRVALLGRSSPARDAELAANLERMEAAGIRFRYCEADVTDPVAVEKAVREVEADLGPITAILHGAGVNVPRRLADLDEDECQRTIAPKVQGARNLLAAIDAVRLKLFIAFGSIIARSGLPGEAHYAVANEWLTRLGEQFQRAHPACRCLVVEWSLWSGVGMGERLGRVDALARQGLTPIAPDQGVAILRRLLCRPSSPVAGRLGAVPTLALDGPDVPRLRFLERPRVRYPGVEFVVDAELSTETDPYLDDHVFRGERLFPAVMGLEAMAQVAMAVVGASDPPTFEDVRFDRPVAVPPGGSLVIRLATLVRETGRVEVVLRSASTAFEVDHFRAVCCFPWDRPALGNRPGPDEGLVAIDPERDLYGGILFQDGRFRRLRAYRRLHATECLAEIGAEGAGTWFDQTLPAPRVLGDPGTRDAAVHAVQACIPHVPLLPIGVDRIVPAAARTSGRRLVHARERSHEGDLFVYDVEVVNPDGTECERWEGLRLQAVKGPAFEGPWIEPLLGPYLERQVHRLLPSSRVSIAVIADATSDRRARSDRAIQQALGRSTPVRRRPDGKPEVDGAWSVSAAHAGELTLAVAGPGPIACDVEPVVPRSEAVWDDLIGAERAELRSTIAQEMGEDVHTAATRVWAARECLKKAGEGTDAPLVLAAVDPPGGVVLACGSMIILSQVVRRGGPGARLVYAIAVRRGGRSYEYRHVVGLEETNVVGNVYYANHVRWQGRCRELFLRDHAPAVLERLGQDLCLVTTRCSCQYLAEISAFDEVIIRMRLGALTGSRIEMVFEYLRRTGDGEEIVALGEQEVACMRRDGPRLLPVPVPDELREALRPYCQG